MIFAFQRQFSRKVFLVLICCPIIIILTACSQLANPSESPTPIPTPTTNPTASTSPDQLVIHTDIPSNKIILTEEDQKRILDIYSSSGIGKAAISLTGTNPWPLIILRFHLKGLEKLSIAYRDIELSASISSSPPYEIQEYRILPDGLDQGIDQSSTLWMDIQLISGEDFPAEIPLKAGYIQAALPEDLYTANPKTFSISWIDFYR
jgi:hypothetical protein